MFIKFFDDIEQVGKASVEDVYKMFKVVENDGVSMETQAFIKSLPSPRQYDDLKQYKTMGF